VAVRGSVVWVRGGGTCSCSAAAAEASSLEEQEPLLAAEELVVVELPSDDSDLVGGRGQAVGAGCRGWG
jgi:hypothetical protein